MPDDLLNPEKSYLQLVLAYLGPYFVYVALSSLPDGFLNPEQAQLLKLVATAVVMGIYWPSYRFGRLTSGQVANSLLAFPLALLAWLAPLGLMQWFGFIDTPPKTGAAAISDLSFWLRLFNSVILVAMFEELLMRVFMLRWFHQAGRQREEKGMLNALVDTLEQHPEPPSSLPLSTFSVIGATMVFTAGHRVHEYPAAIAYFLFTTWVYRRTGSLWVCILVHSLTNLAIAMLVRGWGLTWLW